MNCGCRTDDHSQLNAIAGRRLCCGMSGGTCTLVGMPELPEVTALAAFLTEHAAGQPIVAVTVASLNVLTTYDPPASALVGRVITGAGRPGKFLDIVTGPGAPPNG